jgi:hypothetical protein
MVIMGLNVFEKVNGFEKKPEAKQPGEKKQYNEHMKIFG